MRSAVASRSHCATLRYRARHARRAATLAARTAAGPAAKRRHGGDRGRGRDLGGGLMMTDAERRRLELSPAGLPEVLARLEAST